jgi:hypothetical protein
VRCERRVVVVDRGDDAVFDDDGGVELTVRCDYSA